MRDIAIRTAKWLLRKYAPDLHVHFNPGQHPLSRMKLNGAVKQKGDLAQHIWQIDETIAFLSDYVAIEAGDIIMMGTPAGVAARGGRGRTRPRAALRR